MKIEIYTTRETFRLSLVSGFLFTTEILTWLNGKSYGVMGITAIDNKIMKVHLSPSRLLALIQEDPGKIANARKKLVLVPEHEYREYLKYRGSKRIDYFTELLKQKKVIASREIIGFEINGQRYVRTHDSFAAAK